MNLLATAEHVARIAVVRIVVGRATIAVIVIAVVDIATIMAAISMPHHGGCLAQQQRSPLPPHHVTAVAEVMCSGASTVTAPTIQTPIDFWPIAVAIRDVGALIADKVA